MVSAVVMTTEDEITNVAQAPLLQEDYREMKGKAEGESSDYQESILGRRYYYWVRYVEEKPSENRDNNSSENTGNHTPEPENVVVYDSSSYHIYESWNEKIIDIIWKDRVEDTRWESQDCTEQWNAQIGRYSSDDSGASYEIKYADKILALHTNVGREMLWKEYERLKQMAEDGAAYIE